jgi:serine/threonine-protein kinase RsbT
VADLVGETTLAISCEDDIVLVRRQVRELAGQIGLDTFATAAITTATSELTRNVFVHGGGGRATVQELRDGARRGIRAVFEDEGPGIPDLERVLRGGFSSARSLGLGLSGSRRLVDEFSIESQVGLGTRITILKWARSS